MADNQLNEGTLSDEALQQVVGYVKHQAAKSNADLLTLIDRSAVVIERSVEGVSESQAQFCPAPGEWSVAEVLRHVAGSMHGTARLVRTLSAGESASARMVDPPMEDTRQSLAEVREEVARSFDDLRAAIASIPEGATSAATANHPFFGDLTGREWAAFAYVHARDHADQIEKSKSAAGYP
jgi:hypothetical protein